MSDNHILSAPCAACPFRKDVPIYLRQSRREEIAQHLYDGIWFPCHNTVEYHDEDDHDTSKAKSCAGAVKALALVGGTTQMDRIAERLGMGSIERTADHKIETWPLNDWVRLAEGATGDEPVWEIEEEIETCCTVNAGCLAPAGYLTGSGGVQEGLVAADGRCTMCDEALCSNCADSQGRCGMCTEEDED